jgi:hypothetical protein
MPASPRKRCEGASYLGGSGKSSSTQIVVGLLVALGLDGFGLIVGIEDHVGKSTDITIFTPPPGTKHWIQAMRALARWRFALKSDLKPRSHASQRR